MTELKFYVTLSVPNRALSDKNYPSNCEYITECMREIAIQLKGDVIDLEIK